MLFCVIMLADGISIKFWAVVWIKKTFKDITIGKLYVSCHIEDKTVRHNGYLQLT